MKTTIRIPNQWTPRDYQLPVLKYIDNGGKRAVLKWHRRSGKDDLALHLAAGRIFKRIGVYWHILPAYTQARKAIWDAVDPNKGIRRIDWAFPRELRKTTNEQEMKITFKNGSVWQAVGSDNFNELVGTNPVGIVFSEYALCKPEAYSYLSPILEENGGYAIFISTVRGQNHFTEMFDYALKNPNWYASRVDADQSGVFTEKQLQDIKQDLIRLHGKDFGLQIYRQEYFNDEQAVVSANAVFGGNEIDLICRPKPQLSTMYFIGRTMGVDIARFGSNENVAHILDHYMDGTTIEHATEVWQGQDATFTQGKIFELLLRYKIKACNIDSDGLGGAVLDNVRAMCNNSADYNGKGNFIINEYHNIKQSGPYGNLTTENYFKSRELAAAGKLYLSDRILISQLAARRFIFNGTQKVLESKKEWKTGESGSPDRADAHIMALAAKDFLRDESQQYAQRNAGYDMSVNFVY